MNLLERVEVEVSRQARLVLLVRLGRRRRRPRFARLAETPWFPRRAAEPRAVHQQAVSAAPVIPCAADSLRHRARRYVEGRGGRPVLHIAVEPELILKRCLLKGVACQPRLSPVDSGHVSRRSLPASPLGPYSRSLDGGAIAKKSTLASRCVWPIFDR